MAFTVINVVCLQIINCDVGILCIFKQVAENLVDLSSISAPANQTLLPPVSQPVTQPTSNSIMSAGL